MLTHQRTPPWKSPESINKEDENVSDNKSNGTISTVDINVSKSQTREANYVQSAIDRLKNSISNHDAYSERLEEKIGEKKLWYT